MDCEQLAPLYEEYALGVLEGEDARGNRSAPGARVPALHSWNRESALGRRSARADVARSAASSLVKRQGPECGQIVRQLDRIRQSPASRAVFPVWAWAAAAALAILTGYSIRQMGNQTTQLAELRRQMKVATMQNKALQDQLEVGRQVASVMMSPDSMPLKLMPKDKNMPMVHAYLHPHMGVAITCEQMPAMPAARTLQLWSVPKNGKPMSVAIFHPDSQGQIVIVAPVNMPMNEIAMLAVTEEPAGGSPQPTAAIAWSAQVN